MTSLAEGLPGLEVEQGRVILKAFPLKRANRRTLLASPNWVVHLCSGPPRSNDPLAAWCANQGFVFLPIDLRQKGGRDGT